MTNYEIILYLVLLIGILMGIGLGIHLAFTLAKDDDDDEGRDKRRSWIFARRAGTAPREKTGADTSPGKADVKDGGYSRGISRKADTGIGAYQSCAEAENEPDDGYVEADIPRGRDRRGGSARLRSRLKQPRMSYEEFNCQFTGEDHCTKLQNEMRQQDESYHFLQKDQNGM